MRRGGVGGMLTEAAESESQDQQEGGVTPAYTEGSGEGAGGRQRDPGAREQGDRDARDEARGQGGNGPGSEHREIILNHPVSNSGIE